MLPPSPALAHLLPLLLATSATLRLVQADARLDGLRTGSWLTDIPFYRSGQGTNVVPVQVGSTNTRVNFTVTTNVDFVVVATDQCADCTLDTERFVPEDSNTYDFEKDISYTVILPQLPDDTLTFNARFGLDRLFDAREDGSRQYPIAAADSIRFGGVSAGGEGVDGTLPTGIAGFYGLGINRRPVDSLIPYMSVDDQYLPATGGISFALGMDVFRYDRRPGAQAGTLHWGGIPQGAYVGEFNWYETNQSVAGTWGLSMGNIRMGGNVVDASGLYGSLDPGYDGIYVPTRIAEQLLGGISGVSRDPDDPRRWNIPCNYIQSLSITLSGTTYATSPQQLVEPRDAQRTRCFSQVQAWANGSVPDIAGEVRLGTSFLSGVYPVFYWSANERYVGLAGKPDSVNNDNLVRGKGGIRNMIGCLLAVLLILLGICYGRNANTWQSIFNRYVRDTNRVQYNAVVRATTIPPMMAMAPAMGPMDPMMPGAMGMNMGMGSGMMGPMGAMGGPGMMGAPGMMGQPGMMGPMGPMTGAAGMGMGPGMGVGMGGYGQQQQPPAYQAPMAMTQAHQVGQQQQPLLGPAPGGRAYADDLDEKEALETHDRPAFLGLAHFRRSRNQNGDKHHSAPIPPHLPPKPDGYVSPRQHTHAEDARTFGRGRNAIKVPGTNLRLSPPPSTEKDLAAAAAARAERRGRVRQSAPVGLGAGPAAEASAGARRSRSRGQVPVHQPHYREDEEQDIGVVGGHRRTSRGTRPTGQGSNEARQAGGIRLVHPDQTHDYQQEQELYDPYEAQPALHQPYHPQAQAQQQAPQQPYALDPGARGTYHRPTDSAFEHAPPLSATSRSIWKFGKGKPTSIARGYTAVPNKLASRYDMGAGSGSGSGDTAHKVQTRELRRMQEENLVAQQQQQQQQQQYGEAGGYSHGQGAQGSPSGNQAGGRGKTWFPSPRPRRNVAVPQQRHQQQMPSQAYGEDGQRMRDANPDDSREGWEAVERNSEREGLGNQGAWR